MDERQNGVRINKMVSDSGYCSRRQADELVHRGDVTINGRRAEMGDRVLPGDEVLISGRPLRPVSERKYIAFHKPRGVVSTADPRERANIVDFIGFPERIFPIGRLDKESEGLILLTNDGDIVNRILRAQGMHEKEYIVRVNKPITTDFLTKMASGVAILDTVTQPCRIEKLDRFSFRLILTQGLNRQIRRMCEALGYTVKDLLRVRIMNIHLGQLAMGHWRYLTENELTTLVNSLE